MSNNPTAPSPESPASRGFSIVRVLSLVFGIALLAGGGYFIRELTHKPPALVPFTGKIIFQGKPVTVGGLATMRIGDSLDGANAALDSEGRFELRTNGEPGAFAGKHKVVISANTPTMPPSPLVPPMYSSMQTTPLIIEVFDDPTKNTVEWTLEGTIPEPPPAGQAPPTLSPPENGQQPPAEGEKSPEPPADEEAAK